MNRPGNRDSKKLIRSFPVLRKKLLSWFNKNKRDFPWRMTHNWFHLLIAEMMLRRTRAEQVLPIYEDFTRRYQNVTDTTRLKEKELQKLLYPLGLHWRSKQLFKTIHYLRDHYRLRVPNKSDDFQKIPGVGPYSNAMLRNRLFNEPLATVDANVVRILLRWQGLPYQAEARRNPDLINLANRFVTGKHSADLNLALLDFSALVCRPRTPHCSNCPFIRECQTIIRDKKK